MPLAPGWRQGWVTEAEGVSRSGKNARLCSWPGLWRLPLSLGRKFPRPWRRWMSAGRQPVAGRPARKAQICGIGSKAQGGSPAGCSPAGAVRPESLRTTLPVRARAGEREAGTRALFIGAQCPGLGLPAQPSGSRERGRRSPVPQAKQLPPGVQRTGKQASVHGFWLPRSRSEATQPRGARAARRANAQGEAPTALRFAPARRLLPPPLLGLGGRRGLQLCSPLPGAGLQCQAPYEQSVALPAAAAELDARQGGGLCRALCPGPWALPESWPRLARHLPHRKPWGLGSSGRSGRAQALEGRWQEVLGAFCSGNLSLGSLWGAPSRLYRESAAGKARTRVKPGVTSARIGLPRPVPLAKSQPHW